MSYFSHMKDILTKFNILDLVAVSFKLERERERLT